MSSGLVKRIGQIIGHCTYRYGYWYVAFMAVRRIVLGPNSELYDIIYYGSMPFEFLMIFCMTAFHSGEPCTACDRHRPLNGQAQADKHEHRFQMVHRIWDPIEARNVWAFMRGIRGFIFLFAIGMVARVIVQFPYAVDSFLNALTFTLPLAYLMWLNPLHNRLRPWCKYCRKGGGDDEKEVVPEPDPSMSR